MSALHREAEPCIWERWRDAIDGMLGLRDPASAELVDNQAVARAVEHYAREIGCTRSNAVAAIAYGLRVGGDTMACVRAGKQRARNLLHRQKQTPPSVA